MTKCLGNYIDRHAGFFQRIGVYFLTFTKKILMAKDLSKQVLANLIQANEVIVSISRSGYLDEDLKQFFTTQSLEAKERIKLLKQKMKDTFYIEYDADSAKQRVIKEGSKVELLVNHMDGMKGGTAIVKSYSLPAMLSDITMNDGMKMGGHKWLTNDEVKL